MDCARIVSVIRGGLIVGEYLGKIWTNFLGYFTSYGVGDENFAKIIEFWQNTRPKYDINLTYGRCLCASSRSPPVQVYAVAPTYDSILA